MIARVVATFLGVLGLVSSAHSADIQVYPESIHLDGPRAQQRLVVLARDADGRIRDHSRDAVATVVDSKIALVRGGVVSPIGDGKTTMTIAVGSATTTVPIEVKKSKTE